MVMAVANMVLRPLGIPLTGSFELMGLGCAVTAALGFALAQEQKSHIAVDILFSHFPPVVRAVLNAIGCLICTLLFTAASWRLFHMGLIQLETGEVSETLRLPFYPVIWIVAAGFAALSLRLVIEAALALQKALNSHTGKT
jgi:TRAP-type C4-dicarboxylate transport system permease small subunit